MVRRSIASVPRTYCEHLLAGLRNERGIRGGLGASVPVSRPDSMAFVQRRRLSAFNLRVATALTLAA